MCIRDSSYLEDSDDTRHSPSETFIGHAIEAGATCAVHDPYVHEYKGDLNETLAGADAAVLLVAHTAYKALDWGAVAEKLRTKVLVDARHVVDAGAAETAGLVFRSLGNAAGEPS